MGQGDGVAATQAYAKAELDARTQAAGAGYEDEECTVIDFYVVPINYLVPPPPGSPLWTAQVVLECEDRPVLE